MPAVVLSLKPECWDMSHNHLLTHKHTWWTTDGQTYSRFVHTHPTCHMMTCRSSMRAVLSEHMLVKLQALVTALHMVAACAPPPLSQLRKRFWSLTKELFSFSLGEHHSLPTWQWNWQSGRLSLERWMNNVEPHNDRLDYEWCSNTGGWTGSIWHHQFSEHLLHVNFYQPHWQLCDWTGGGILKC